MYDETTHLSNGWRHQELIKGGCITHMHVCINILVCAFAFRTSAMSRLTRTGFRVSALLGAPRWRIASTPCCTWALASAINAVDASCAEGSSIDSLSCLAPRACGLLVPLGSTPAEFGCGSIFQRFKEAVRQCLLVHPPPSDVFPLSTREGVKRVELLQITLLLGDSILGA